MRKPSDFKTLILSIFIFELIDGDNVEIVNDIYYFGNKNKTDKDDSKKVKYKS